MAEKKQVNNNEERENTNPKKKMSPGKIVLIGFGLVFLGLGTVQELCSIRGGNDLAVAFIFIGVMVIIAGVVYNFQTSRENKKK